LTINFLRFVAGLSAMMRNNTKRRSLNRTIMTIVDISFDVHFFLRAENFTAKL
jgi:hypothetical protein